MSDAIFFAPLRVPVADPRTGIMSREWYLFFQAMFLRSGGTQPPLSAEDLQIFGDMSDATDDASDVKASAADLERSLALLDEAQPAIITDAASDFELPAEIAGNPQDASDALLLNWLAAEPDPGAQIGTFTPTVQGSTTPGVTTYSLQQGNYTIIGNRCLFNLRVSWTAVTGTGNLQLAGMPAANNANGSHAALSMYYAGTDTGQSYFAILLSGTKTINVYNHIATTGVAALALAASGDIMLAGQYQL